MAMSMGRVTFIALGLAAPLVIAGCGGHGLDPAGPKPGEVDIGYGTRQEKDVTGAVSSVSAEELEDIRPVGIEELLRGRVAGLQILKGTGGQYRFRIRGTNSLLFDQDPLFVVDGVQIAPNSLHTALAGLTSQDIRQVDVLKDIASTSIYGSRGAGGVVIITTRR
jgi:TonB-dependent SusC/RagA subfamily outer membrane receptor